MPRGGYRQGSGRPLKTKDKPRRALPVRVSLDSWEFIYSEKVRTGKSLGELIDSAIDALQYSPKHWFAGKKELKEE